MIKPAREHQHKGIVYSQSILNEINPEYSLEGLMLKLQYVGHLMWRANSLEKTLMLGKIDGKRRMGWHLWLNGHESEETPGDSEGQGSPVCCSPWGGKESDATVWLNSNRSSLDRVKVFQLLPVISEVLTAAQRQKCHKHEFQVKKKKLKHWKKYETMIIVLQVAKHAEKLSHLTTSLDLKSQKREMKY